MKIDIPEAFQVPPFYNESYVVKEDTVASLKDICQAVPFYYDITLEKRPWKQKHTYVPMLLDWWKDEEPLLEHFYAKRNPKAANKKMIVMTAVFIDALFWMNETQVQGITTIAKKVNSLQFKPVNCEERLAFILNGPIRYHTYVQLKAMYVELGKLYAKSKVLEANKSKR
ncbi:YpoC family protein [Halalkalibacter okhensis]|uniref:YpoC-like domain-containing protein n=1 Tax=Halalkalibacter okhensis TaxID=333138 RepID=A0A0B0IKW5_9BACI|nr:hypothetical protein [Halalkalibacter okhensis]KHF40296.1 hypothetical protein LQ50_09875 [Halalkalibacter okhensis]